MMADEPSAPSVSARAIAAEIIAAYALDDETGLRAAGLVLEEHPVIQNYVSIEIALTASTLTQVVANHFGLTVDEVLRGIRDVENH